ncbi:MAG: carbohydrate ABC transporter permease [Candidatus Hadarchaeum sp.]|uniref:carbohydrate ABC transporter permease n=1 Tax=Candidatus Hadarchaeum sp. TaxID=2883567 RepID=UPI003177B51E
MILTSLQPSSELMQSPPRFITSHPTLDHWRFTIRNKLQPFINSLIVSSSATVVAVFVGSLSGYAFARYQVGGNTLPFWILSLRFFPPIAAAVPFFIMMNRFRLLDTHIAVIVPHLIITIPFAVWMIRGFVAEVPRELEEAAMIDGCSHLGVIRRVTLPLIAPGIVVTALFCFIWSWNEFLFALVLTRSHAMTLPVAIAGMREAHGLMWGAVSAAATMATLPVLVMAIVLQKYLVRGLALGAVK